MRSQAVLRILITLFFSLLLIGCASNVLEIPATIAVNSELEVTQASTMEKYNVAIIAKA